MLAYTLVERTIELNGVPRAVYNAAYTGWVMESHHIGYTITILI